MIARNTVILTALVPDDNNYINDDNYYHGTICFTDIDTSSNKIYAILNYMIELWSAFSYYYL